MILKDKVIVITGASKGIGKSLAILFVSKGAQVVASDRSDTDVRKEVEVQALAKRIVAEFGRIDMWINNAGVFHTFSPEEPFIDMTKAHEIVDTNLFGTIFGCRTALGHMKINNGGVIVNILSTAALDATRAKNAKIYAASKWAIRGYVQALKAENEGSGVAIFSVYPGGTRTDLYRENKPANFEEYMDSDFVAQQIVENLEKENPEEELIIKRPGV